MNNTPDLFYRYTDCDSLGNLRYSVYKLDKETDKGYWIEGHSYRKWISKTSRKKFAYPSKEDALKSFKLRKQSQIQIITKQLEGAKRALSAIAAKSPELENTDYYNGEDLLNILLP